MKIVVAALVRNEASRFWRSALEAWWDFASDIVVVDDGSTDETPEIAERSGCILYEREDASPAWGEEAPARQMLWKAALENTQKGDWILVLDADMIPANDPRDLLHEASDSVAFRIFDLWGQDGRGKLVYRNDSFWRAHNHFRVWMVKRPKEPEEGWLWSARGIHTGHFPTNLDFGRTLYAPLNYSLLHYAYVNDALRRAKAKQYEAQAEQLTAFEQQHAVSILHPKPVLVRLPFPVKYTLTIGDDSDG